MKVRYSRRAIADLVGIADYVREHNPPAAAALEKRIRASIEQLQMFPYSGRSTDDPSMRMFPIVRYPYLVFYEVGVAFANAVSRWRGRPAPARRR